MSISQWHALELGDVLTSLNTQTEGLSSGEASRRHDRFGPNRIPSPPHSSPFTLLARQTLNPLILLLFGTFLITLFLGRFPDSWVIGIVIGVNVAFGFFQEFRASTTLASLRNQEKKSVRVIRDGVLVVVPQETLVPGDRLVVRPGDQISADARLIRASGVSVSEALLTGESQGVGKETGTLRVETSLPDRTNMLWMGSYVLDGVGEAIVVEIGAGTQLGLLGVLLAETREVSTPFERKMRSLVRFLTIGTSIIAVLLFLLGLILGRSAAEMFLVSVAVAVSAVPEGLATAVTIVLAIGAVRLATHRGLVRSLSAAQALGSVDVILTDKTGTLTGGVLSVSDVQVPSKRSGIAGLEPAEREGETARDILRMASYVADPAGNATDRAILSAARDVDVSAKVEAILNIPFSSERQHASSFIKTAKAVLLVVLGAPEEVLRRSSQSLFSARPRLLQDEDRVELRASIENVASHGARAVALAMREIPPREVSSAMRHPEDYIHDLSFAGLIVLEDILREDASDTIETARRAGIRTIMVAGDPPATASAIAIRSGIVSHKAGVVTGAELSSLGDNDLVEKIRSVSVWARIVPTQKVRLVRAWQHQGATLAMIGDGVNDAPALKTADVGVAIASGADLARDSADLILLKGTLSTLVEAVRQGRVILDNLKKVITYLLSDSFSEVVLISVSLLLGLPLPLLPVQILWAKVVSDTLPAAALAFERPEQDIMRISPYRYQQKLVDRQMWFLILGIGLVTDAILVGLFLFFLSIDLPIDRVRSLMFAALVIETSFYVFSLRSLRRPLWSISPFSNRYLMFAVAGSLILLCAALYLPFLQQLLRTTPITALEWLILVGFGIVNVLAIELGKWVFYGRRANA